MSSNPGPKQPSKRAVRAPNIPTVELLGANVYVGDVGSAARSLIDLAFAGSGGYACLFNAHVSVEASRNRSLASAIRRAALVLPDGWPVAKLARYYAGQGDRIAGADLMERAIDIGRRDSVRHAFFGSNPETLAAITDRLASRYPGAQIVGRVAPPLFGVDELERTQLHVDEIREHHPHILWCGLGAPKQELWMAKYSTALAPTVAVGVGAAFNFIARPELRAPLWMQRAGLEWSYRLYREPFRLIGRYSRTNSKFVLLAASELRRRRTN